SGSWRTARRNQIRAGCLSRNSPSNKWWENATPTFFNRASFWRKDVKSELAAIKQAPADSKNPPQAAPTRPVKGKRRSTGTASHGGSVRFFLSKAESNGIPVLDREFPTEPEVILESLKTGKTYFVISEWKGAADLSKKMPLIRKEIVTSRRQTAD